MLRAIIDQIWLTWRLLLDKRVPFWMKALLAIPLIYVLSPIDLIPDFIVGLGQLDDLGIMLAGMRIFEALVPEYIVQEHRGTLKQKRDHNVIESRKYTIRQPDRDQNPS